MPQNENNYFELPSSEKPIPHFMHQYWYPGVEKTWEYATSSRIFDPIFGVRAIAIHATAGSSTYGAMSVMKGGNASWHWLVPDENEKAHGKFAWACAPEARAAWHIRNAVSHPFINNGQNKINHWSLGIEIVNNQTTADEFSEWQLNMTAKIVRYAWAKYPNLKYVLSHALMDPHRRSDPGTNFDWQRFKSKVITGPPETETAFVASGYEDVTPIDELDAVKSYSVCGDDPTNEVHDAPETSFTTEPKEIDWEMAVLLAEASKVIYDKKSIVLNWAKNNLGTNQVEFIDRKDTQLFIAENETETYIVFRGSKGLGDWIANMKIYQAQKPYGRVHRGFLNAFSVVQSEVFAALTRARVFNRKIYLAGHSLGGALAVVGAAHAKYEIGKTPIHGIYTFGMPKTCNRKCANYIDVVFGSKFLRFVNNDDIVTKIPPLSRHAGRLIHFDEAGKITDEHGPKESGMETSLNDEDLTEEQFAALQKGLKLKKEGNAEGEMIGVNDHDMCRYITNLRRYRDMETKE